VPRRTAAVARVRCGYFLIDETVLIVPLLLILVEQSLDAVEIAQIERPRCPGTEREIPAL
jgi:hypothetical protein